MYENFFLIFYIITLSLIVLSSIIAIFSRDVEYVRLIFGIVMWATFVDSLAWAIRNNFEAVEPSTSQMISLIIWYVFVIYRPRKIFVTSVMFDALSFVLAIALFLNWGGPLIFLLYHLGSGNLMREGFSALVDEKFYQCLWAGLIFFGISVVSAIVADHEPRGSIGATLRKVFKKRTPTSPVSQADDGL